MVAPLLLSRRFHAHRYTRPHSRPQQLFYMRPTCALTGVALKRWHDKERHRSALRWHQGGSSGPRRDAPDHPQLGLERHPAANAGLDTAIYRRQAQCQCQAASLIMAAPSLRQCINDKCRWCIYDKHGAGNWRQQVTACSVIRCPLWRVRPVTRPLTRAERAALRAQAEKARAVSAGEGSDINVGIDLRHAQV